jgi:hypothetical protein
LNCDPPDPWVAEITGTSHHAQTIPLFLYIIYDYFFLIFSLSLSHSAPPPTASLPLETGSCYVAQSGFKFSILLPEPPECWDYTCAAPLLALFFCSAGDWIQGLCMLDKCPPTELCSQPYFLNWNIVLNLEN